ncbi:shikimate kinase, partial [Clostridium tarantellae]
MKKNILLIGMPGCGKTTLGKELAKKINYKFIDMDEFIVENSGKSIKELFEKGEENFRKIESKCCEILSTFDYVVISSGGGVIKKEKNIRYFSKFNIVFINRPIYLIMKDLDINSRPLLQEGKEKLINLYKERIHLYNIYK